MLTLLAAVTCLVVVIAGPAHWTLVEAGFRLVCHQIPERSLWIAGTPMPVCARCTGLYFGALAALLSRIPAPRPALLAAVALMILDVASEAAGLRPALAGLRLATGLALGFAAAPAVDSAIRDMRA